MKRCVHVDAFIQTLSIFLYDADTRYMEKNLRKSIDSFRRSCEIAAYRVHAKNILPHMHKSFASSEEKDVSSVKSSINSCSLSVALKIVNNQMELARRKSALEEEMVRMEQENKRRKVDHEAEQAQEQA